MEDQEYYNDGNQAVYDDEGRQLFGKERKRWLKEQKRAKYLDQLQQNSQSFEDVDERSYNPSEDKWEDSEKEDDFIPSTGFVQVSDSPKSMAPASAASAPITPGSTNPVATNLSNLSSARGLPHQTESKPEIKASPTPVSTSAETVKTASDSESLDNSPRPSLLEKFKGSLPALSQINPVQWLKKIPTIWKGRSLNEVVQEEFDAISKKETPPTAASSSNGNSKELSGAIKEIEKDVVQAVGRNWGNIAKQTAGVATLVTALLGGGYGAILYFSPKTTEEMLSNVGISQEMIDEVKDDLSKIGDKAKDFLHKVEADLESKGGDIYNEIKDATAKHASLPPTAGEASPAPLADLAKTAADATGTITDDESPRGFDFTNTLSNSGEGLKNVLDEVNNQVQSALSDASRMLPELTASPSTAGSGSLALPDSGPIQDPWSSEETALHTTPSPVSAMVSQLESPSSVVPTGSPTTSTLTLPTSFGSSNSTGNSWLDKANSAVDQVNTLANNAATAMNNVGNAVNSVSQEATQVRDTISQGASALQSTMSQNTDQLSNQVSDQLSSWGTAIGQTASNVASGTEAVLNNVASANSTSNVPMTAATVPASDGFTPLNFSLPTASPTAPSTALPTATTSLPTNYGSSVYQTPPATGSGGSYYNSPDSNNNVSTREYVTKERDNLLTIADYELGDTTRWKEIGHLNVEIINALPQGTRYFPLGTKLRLPLK